MPLDSMDVQRISLCGRAREYLMGVSITIFLSVASGMVSRGVASGGMVVGVASGGMVLGVVS